MERNLESEGVQETNIDLARLYPVTGLIDFRKTIFLLCAAVGSSLIAAGINLAPQYFGVSPANAGWLRVGLRGVAFLLCACWLIRFLYETCRRHSLYYGIEDGHLVISRGIILKQRGFFPLSRITDIYLERSFLDLLFGLHTLHVSTPTSLSERFARIEGLSRPMALALQRRLASTLERFQERTTLRSIARDYEEHRPHMGFAAAAAA